MDKPSNLKFYELIGRILWEDWDPIGVKPFGEAARDEYDSYIAGVHKLLKEGASSDAISAHLMKIEEETIGLTPAPSEAARTLEVAEKLIESSRDFLK